MGTLKIGSAKEQKGVTIYPFNVLFNGNNVKKIKKDNKTIWRLVTDVIVYNKGVEDDEFKISSINGIGTLTRNASNITYSMQSQVYDTAGVYIDLTRINKVTFTGYIDDINNTLGHLIITKNKVVNKDWNTSGVKSSQLATSQRTYEIDVSDLKGYYYVCFGGSSRTVTCTYLALN